MFMWDSLDASTVHNGSGDMVAEWIARGILNPYVVGSSLSAASLLLCNILGQDVNSMPASAWRGMGTTRLTLALDTPLKFSGAPAPEGLWD